MCLAFFFSEGPCVRWGCYLWLLCASGHTYTHTHPFTGWKGSHTACKHDFTALGGMSGGGENEDRVQKGKALRFTGPSSQNATMKQDTFLRLFFSFNQKHSFSEKKQNNNCRDVQKYNNPQADYCLFCVYASFFFKTAVSKCDLFLFITKDGRRSCMRACLCNV